ncbi:uncharacterized protein DSM5745_08626 [Aspergillus mulundensis]|uniref:Allergen Asp f 4 n=1 Tax=Aspergillus mulundensis TaxID=1810919 RepID=A0A3D8R4G3_9EURO|nr:hypothetical protein DSM5745_08626 [Aspergillus mulundensis]RDW68866.1 hypothetical protein DSM5745_08626 [Aspergillus mulundensis]
MQWKSLVFTLATAGSALARSHGSHKHRHGARHEAAQEVGGFYDSEPVYVTETAWECCTTSTLSSITATAPATFVEIPEIPTETPSSTEIPTSTQTPVVETSSSTSTPVPTETEAPATSTETPAPEPETTSSSAAPTSTEAPTGTSVDHSAWTNFPSSGEFSYKGFGGRTSQSITGNKFTYSGNVGTPWGSNIQEVSAEEAAQYKYVVQFHGSKTDKWTVIVWNKIGPDMKMTGWYGNSAVSFSLEPEEIRYVAFDENSQGSWGAAKGDSLPTDEFGGYSCTWGEFDLGSEVNGGWSGWDVSAIQAEAAGQHIQGMKMCAHDDTNCSIITTGAKKVQDAYMEKDKWADGIGGKVVPGPVRIVTHLDYDE